MKLKKHGFMSILFSVVVFLSFAASEKIPSPEEIIGFKVGQDFKLANWNRILVYFDKLSSTSDRVELIDLGQTTLGKRFIMAVISSPANIARLDEIKEIQKKLHDPRSFDPAEKDELVKKGKAIVFISCSLHSTEIAASQMSMDLAYKLATEESPEIKEILEEVFLLLVPSMNPDGIDIVVDWYFKQLGTPYEGCPMPWLYHHYVGHDNNRDWFMLTQKETQIITKVLYHDWFPLLVYDIHQMRTHGPRLFIPPYYNPVNPNLDPLLLREQNVLAGKAAVDLTEADKTGIATNWNYELWRGMGCRSVPMRHNVMGILSEAASVNIASPLFIKPNEIKIMGKGIQGAGIQASYLEPWTGGRWRLSDIIDYEEIVAFSFLKTIAQNKEDYLSTFTLLAQRQIQKGMNEPPFAYVVPPDQKDLPTTIGMLQILQLGGAEIYEAKQSFMADDEEYPAMTFIVPLAQPYRAHIKDVMEVKPYPLIINDGIPELPRDEIAWTLPIQMGVKAVEVVNPFEVKMRLLPNIVMPPTRIIGTGSKFFILPNETNNGSILINRLLKKGVECLFFSSSFALNGKIFLPGTTIFSKENISRSQLLSLSKDLGLTLYAVVEQPKVDLKQLAKPEIGIYQSWVPNKDEGWLRWTLDQFEFAYKLIHNAELKEGSLNRSYTHIILPNMPASMLLEGRKKEEVPPPYTGGIGDEGASALEDFVRKGGKLVAIGDTVDFVIKYLGLPVKSHLSISSTIRNVYEALSLEEKKDIFFCPGSLLRANINDSHPLGFGMKKQGAVFSYFSPFFEVEKGSVVISYPDSNLLLTGVLLNEDKIMGKAGAVECDLDEGKIVLFGFKVIHRGQAHGTFKFLFNSLFY